MVIPPWTRDYRECLRKVVESCRTKISLTKDLTDIEEVIRYCRLLRDSAPPGSTSLCNVAISLAHLLRFAFVKSTISMNLSAYSQVSSKSQPDEHFAIG